MDEKDNDRRQRDNPEVQHKKHKEGKQRLQNPSVQRSLALLLQLLLCLVLPVGGLTDTVTRQSLSQAQSQSESQTETQSQTDAVKRRTVDLGQEVVLSCGQEQGSHISWQFVGVEHLRLNTTGSLITANSGDLVIPKAKQRHSGLYSCLEGQAILSQTSLSVRDVPSRVSNMSVHTNSVFAVVSWDSPGTEQGLQVAGFQCGHRRDTSHYTSTPSDRDLQWAGQELPPTASQCAVYNLLPNTTYYFRVSAVNRLGAGEFVSMAGTTRPLVRSLGVLPQGSGEEGGYGRVMAVCLSVSLLGLVTLGSGIALLLVKRGKQVPRQPLKDQSGEEESLELVPPHITLNPSFNIDMLEHIGEEESSEHAFLVDHGGAGG